MEESFVVLPPPSASVYKSADGGGTTHVPSHDEGTAPTHANNSTFHSTITVLKRAFEIATTQTQVEQPLCLECMRVLSDKLDKEVEDVNTDIKAYEACLQRLEGEPRNLLSEADFLREKLKLRHTASLSLSLSLSLSHTHTQRVTHRCFSGLSNGLSGGRWNGIKPFIILDRVKQAENYSTSFILFTYLITHSRVFTCILFYIPLKIEEEERKLEAAIQETEKQCSQVTGELKELELKSNRFKELEERYWHEFNNFQFQLISHQVEWDEINATWGQACLLLHTMAQYFRPKYQYRIKILPMGSYPRIMDSGNNTYELFGPVNLFWSTRYDKAMTLFLTCLKEFAEFANSKDKENNIPADKCFKLPYKIENDKVESYSITQSFNKQENWTKALKYTLCNLKWVLFWFVGNTNFQPLSQVPSSSSSTSLYRKQQQQQQVSKTN